MNPAALCQTFQTDQQRIPGKGGNRRVRRVSVCRRAQRQNLPQALASGGEKIDKLAGNRAKIANATARRQRRGVKQNSGRAGKWHVSSKRRRLPGLLALFPTLSASQLLHLFLVDFDLAELVHLIMQVADKQAEKFRLLVLQERIPNLISLRGKIRGDRFLLFYNHQNGSRIAVADR